ncbi:MAG: DUF3106 domain-containing protein [Coraliomargaritaceae bacterium]
MKTDKQILSILLLLCLIFSGQSFAQSESTSEKVTPPAHQPGKKPLRSTESRLLQHFLSMDQAELAKIRQTLERIEKMSPEERAGLRKRMKEMQASDPAKVEAMRQYYQSIPKETREAMRQRWDAMTADQRADWRRRLQGLSQTERLRVFEEEGFLPGGRPRHKPGSGKGREGIPQKPASGQ